jgi:DNA-binding XRE family transcriptional regulator
MANRLNSGKLEGPRGAFGGISRKGEVEDRMGQERKRNSLKTYREQAFISKAELARKAGISEETISRIENGKSCRLETKRKIILAFGLELSESDKIFG